MPEYNDPNSTEFEAAESSILDIMSTRFPLLSNKNGSVVRELVIRPLAYIYAWTMRQINSFISETSISNLATSSRTENQYADLVLGNFFITRKQGTNAKGVLTLVNGSKYLFVPARTTFSISGLTFYSAYAVSMAPQGRSPYVDRDTYYIPATPINLDGVSCFMFNIPIICSTPGEVEIPAGTPVTSDSLPDSVLQIHLTSPITGGRGIETDAEMVKRAAVATVDSGVGSYYGILRKLDKCPCPIISIAAMPGESAIVHSGRANTVNINTGSVIDIYAKTQNQCAVNEIDATAVYSQKLNKHIIEVDSAQYPGFYQVTGIIVDGNYMQNWEVEYNEAYKRLGTKQKAIIKIGLIGREEKKVRVIVSYMPYVDTINSFLSSPDNQYIGQQVEVKAAVPVNVSIRCSYNASSAVSSETLLKLKNGISGWINSFPIGAHEINFSKMAEYCKSITSECSLSLPCVISAEIPLPNGSTDTIYSNTGLFDLNNPANSEYWDSRICFVSTSQDKIRLEPI